MELRSLLLCKDERAVRILTSLLSEREIKVEVFGDLGMAQERLWTRKFDGVFADCELQDAPELLRSVRRSKHNKRSIAFAIIELETRLGIAFDSGAHFVLHKPLSVEKSKRTLRAAHGLMMREQRSCFRHDAAVPISLKTNGLVDLRASLVDLSQSGALIAAPLVLREQQCVSLRFVLPDTRLEIGMDAVVMWADLGGRAGVSFKPAADHSLRALAEWVRLRSMEGALTPITMAHKPNPAAQAVATVPGKLMSTPQACTRVLPRGRHNTTIKVLTFRHGRPVAVYGICENINEAGMGAELADDLLVGDHVLIELRMPGRTEPCVVHGEIRHRNGRHYGFELMSLPQRSLN